MLFIKGRLSGIVGAFVGLVAAILVLSIGVFKTLFLAFFILIGYLIGRKFEGSRPIRAIYRYMEGKGSDCRR
jgi:uncharacterized membrane protein